MSTEQRTSKIPGEAYLYPKLPKLPRFLYLACARDAYGIFETAYGSTRDIVEARLQQKLTQVLRPFTVDVFEYVLQGIWSSEIPVEEPKET